MTSLILPFSLTECFAVLFGICLLIQLYFTLFVQLKLARLSIKKPVSAVIHPVSVIIYTRNQAAQLQAYIESLLEQDHPDFELVLVNDCSWDETEDLLRDFAPCHPRLKVVNVPEQERFRRNKKFALSMAIKAASHEHLLFTEVANQPASKKWIREMQANFDSGTELLIGHTPLKRGPGLARFFARYDLFFTAMNALSLALKGKAYLASGRNMAYLKSVFFRGKGFASHMHIPFGEDQFFVNQHADRSNTRVEIRPATHIWTDDFKGLVSHVQFRVKQMKTIRTYPFSRRYMPALQLASGIFFYALLIGLAIAGFDWRILLAAFSLKIILQFAVYFKLFKRLSYRDLKWWFPFLDIFYSLYLFVLSTLLLFNTNGRWK